MRSLKEISFRLRQEATNLFLLSFGPKYKGPLPRRLALPDPVPIAKSLRSTGFAHSVDRLAGQILSHHFPLLGFELNTGADIQWRRDYLHNIESAATYFRRVRYLDVQAVGDHKNVWELNRHQHLVVLAQAYLFNPRRELLHEITAQLESWFVQNPYQRGINWASALEVAFRALSWLWTYHLIAPELPESFLRRWATELYRHGHHLAANLSIYFSPNTHLLGEAVALHAIAALFPTFPHSESWKQLGARTVDEQLSFQVWSDGVHFEQSTYYHVYALDFFVLHYLLAGRPSAYRPVLDKMARYLHWLLGRAGEIAFLGDDDGGRLFHPYGERSQFGRASLATCGILFNKPEWLGTEEDIAQQASWWLGPTECRTAPRRTPPSANHAFRAAGAFFFQSGNLSVQMDAGPFGYGGAGHSHSDTLSLVAWFNGEAVLIDPGTFTYVGDPVERAWFRGSAAHNSVRIDELDQGTPAGPFRWITKPAVQVDSWQSFKNGAFIDASCRYHGFTHRRRVLLASGRLLVLDEISGESQAAHTCEQIWQLGPAADRLHLSASVPWLRRPSKVSPAYGSVYPGTSLVAVVSGTLPISIAFALDTDTKVAITIREARAQLAKYAPKNQSPSGR